MSQPNHTYRRLEALFSEIKTAAPDSPRSSVSVVRSGGGTAYERMRREQDRGKDPGFESLPPTGMAETTAVSTIPIADAPAVQNARFPRLANLWEKLTGANHTITDLGERRQAQLAAALALGLSTLTAIGFVATIATVGIKTSTFFLFAIAFVGLITYFVTRSPYYKFGSAALVIGLAAMGYALAIANPSSVSTSLYEILPFSLIAGSLLLPVWGQALMTGANFILIGYVLPGFMPVYTRSATDSGILMSMGVMLIIAVLFRNAVERSRVSEITAVNRELRSFQTGLEQRVHDRTVDLELASEVGRTVTAKAADLDKMLTEAVELIRSRFNLYYTQVYLLDPTGHALVLRAGTGVVGKQLLQRGHRLTADASSLNGRALMGKKPVVVADTTRSGTFLPNPLLPKTRSEMSVPLLLAGQAVGVLDMQSEIPEALNENNLPAFLVLAGQLAVAIQNANLLAESRESRRQLETNIQRFTSAGWKEFLNGIDRGERIGFSYHQDKLSALEKAPLPLTEQALSVPLKVAGTTIGTLQSDLDGQGWTSQENEIVNATAVQLAQHIEELRLLGQAEKYRAEAEQAVRRLTREGWDAYRKVRNEASTGFLFDLEKVLPLNGTGLDGAGKVITRNLAIRNESIGALAVDTGSVSGENIEILDAVASQLSGHLESLRLLELNEKRARELEIVAELSATTSTVLDPSRLLQAIVDLAKERFGVYHVHIYLTDENSQTLVLAAGAGDVGREMVAAKHAIAMNVEKSLVARANRERKAQIVNDVRSDPDFLPNPRLPSTRSEMAVPMIVGDKTLGVFDVQADKVDGFTEEDANIYTTLASQVAVALQNARLYMEQAEMVTRLRDLDRLKTSFLANMSHELRTPLNSILGFTDVMLEGIDGELTENMGNDLHLIHKNGQHLLHLINDVLDMAKISAGKMNLALSHFKIHDLLEEVIHVSSSLAVEKNLSLMIDADSDRKAEITADRTRIQQVMVNLVGNAVKFTEKGGVNIRTEQKDGKVLVRVSDTGVGIPKEKLDLVFQEFTQVDTSPTRKAGGTGLGLPISLSLVKMHGGRLWAESTGVAGEGTTFYMELPLETQTAEPAKAKVTEHGKA